MKGAVGDEALQEQAGEGRRSATPLPRKGLTEDQEVHPLKGTTVYHLRILLIPTLKRKKRGGKGPGNQVRDEVEEKGKNFGAGNAEGYT